MKKSLTAVLILLAWCSLPAAGQAPAFDHSTFDDLLRAHVTEEGLVDYDAFGRSPEFGEYLQSLAEARPEDLPQAERLAFWINAYNAYTIELINRHQERESIRNINKTLGFISGKGPWKERMAEVGGRTWTLDEMEHEIIRKEFQEPRIHFAVVCAALGCPPLRAEAYTGQELDRQLDGQTRAFLLESPAKNRVHPASGTVFLSPIFDWYREDFPAGRRGLGAYLAEFFPTGPARALLEGGRFDVEFTDYDWSLNADRSQPADGGEGGGGSRRTAEGESAYRSRPADAGPKRRGEPGCR